MGDGAKFMPWDATSVEATVFLALDLPLALALSVVAARLGSHASRCTHASLTLVWVVFTAVLSVALAAWCIKLERWPLAALLGCLALGDIATFEYVRASREEDLRPGKLFFAHVGLGVAMTIGSVGSLGDGEFLYAQSFAGLLPRCVALALFGLDSLSRRHSDGLVDEFALLRHSQPELVPSDFYLRVDSRNSTDPLGESLLNATAPSFVGDFEDRPPTRVSSTSSSFPSRTSSHNVAWGGDEAAGPGFVHATDIESIGRVEVVCWREILSGNVPLVVFVLKHGRFICVHRYGEFRALANRYVTKAFTELGSEPPPFPVRRTFRKLLPVVVGGAARGGDGDFYTARAQQLDAWLGAVIQFFQHEPVPEAAKQALLGFLQPVEIIPEPPAVRPFAPAATGPTADELERAAVDKALRKFSRMLNNQGGIIPPSP